MLKKELAELLKNMKDEDNIDEALKKAEPVMALANSGLTLETFKKKLTDSDFKAYLDSEKDKHATKNLETWRTNNLQKLVDDEYYKKHPEEKQDPTAIELAKLKKQLEDTQRESKLEKIKNTTLKTLTDKKLPSELVDLILNEDEAKVSTSLTSLENIFKSHDEGLKSEFIKGNIYTPGGGEGGKSDISVDIAKKLAAGNIVDENLQTAKENYFK